ncbi:MAG: LCCL domain-containing protein [Pirellulaceae bacterium]|nr:LCCL domain-containing protein [Pirellulaceae bacterium]
MNLLRWNVIVAAAVVAGAWLVVPATADDLPAEAVKLLEKYQADLRNSQEEAQAAKAAIDKQAYLDAKTRTEQCIAALQQLQDSLAKTGQLDEAVAVRDRIRTLKIGGDSNGVKPDPGTLSSYTSGADVGKTHYFEVIGATNFTIYGTDIYSTDSPLAVAAVHAGVLQFAEKGVVKVTILPGMEGYTGSSKNGVRSRDWSSHQASYKVEKAPGFKTTKLGESPATESKPATTNPAAGSAPTTGAILDDLNKKVEDLAKELEKKGVPGLPLKIGK